MIMKNICLPSLFLLLLFSCFIPACTGNQNKQPAPDHTITNKMDISLRLKLDNVDQSGSNEEIAILIQLDKPADEKTLDMLKNHSVDVQTVVNSIVTAKATAESIRQVAADPSILSISLSQTRYRLE
jgi:hypothetical protein